MKLEIIALDKMTIAPDIPEWGDECSKVTLEGDIREVTFSHGNGEVCVRVNEQGEILIADIGHSCYVLPVARQFQLIPQRPWDA